jgi:hypothetical protein
MQTLYPIIRRVRRPLLPPDEPQQRVIIPVTMEPEPAEEVPIVMAPVEPAPVEPEFAEPEFAEAAPVEPSLVATPSTRRSRKEQKRAEIPAT